MAGQLFEDVEESAAAVRRHCGVLPDTALVLGTGLGAIADALGDRRAIPYRDLPHWPVPAVDGHEGELVLGTLAGRRMAVLSGRAHVYEGHDARAATFAVRVLGRLGLRQLLLTNAAGGINADLSPGSLMLVDDHINLLGNPLIGPNEARFGPRFPDMTDVYARRLRDLADEAAQAQGVSVAHGVYAGVTGPSYETPAEIRALRMIGADAVGMSTVMEAIVARHMGIEVLGVSCITNMAAGVRPAHLAHEDVLDTARRAGGALSALLAGIVARL